MSSELRKILTYLHNKDITLDYAEELILEIEPNLMKKKLKNLKEHNDEHRERQFKMNSNEPVLNGIACPECGEELYDSKPMVTLTSMPSQKNVKCSKCDYVGYRVA